MLQTIRDKAHGIVSWILFIIVGIAFVTWGINNYFEGGKEKPIAVVGDREILERDVNRAYENLVSRLGSSDYDEKQVRHEALEQLINDELISQNARDQRLAVSEADIRSYVQSQPYFQSEGKFDKDKLKTVLASQGMSSPQFTAQVAKQLVDEQYVRGVTETAFVTQQQLEAFYRLRNQERKVEYFTIPLKKYEGDIPDKEVEVYYQENKNQFQNPEKVSMEYLNLTLDDVSGDIQVTEEDLKAQYEEQKSQLGSPERRKVSHILISADMDKDDAVKAAQAKAEQVRERLVKGEDFSKIAKEVSDDKDSGAKGGDLGFLGKDAVDPNFAKAAFALGKNEVSTPVKTPFGFHLITVTELVPATTKKFEEVRDELAKNYKRSSAENKFYEVKQKLDELSFEHNDSLEPVAKALNLKIEKTGQFTREAGEGVATEAAVRNAAFTPEVLEGKNSAAVEIGNDKVFVLHLKERQLASDKPLAEVKQDIIAKLRLKRGQEAVRKQAEQVVAEIKQGKSLADAAKAAGVGVNKATVKLVGKADLPPALITAVNKAPLPQGGKSSPAFATLENGEQVVFVLAEVKDGTVASVDPKELAMAKQYLAKNTGQAEFTAYLDFLREKAKVKVNAQDKQE
ncbi:Peptidyl-prolyl cis-trans isomerase D [Anaerolineae bacterium]|nr:Peptidyl-prolyl cis-trans isomerase D [Anaerolineae bacterium]